MSTKKIWFDNKTHLGYYYQCKDGIVTLTPYRDGTSMQTFSVDFFDKLCMRGEIVLITLDQLFSKEDKKK